MEENDIMISCKDLCPRQIMALQSSLVACQSNIRLSSFHTAKIPKWWSFSVLIIKIMNESSMIFLRGFAIILKPV